MKRAAEEMQRYSGIAAWKEMGFFETNISGNLNDMIRQDKTITQRITDKSMVLAQFGDHITWTAIWNACRDAVSRTTNLSPDSEAFFHEVSERFEDVIYRTQVVDSVLTKSQYMRTGTAGHRLFGSFMSEPTATYNMLLSVKQSWEDDVRLYGKGEAWKRNRTRIGRTLSVYTVSALLTSATEAIMDAWRDNDEYEDFWADKYKEAFLQNLGENLNPLNLLPVVSQLWDAAKFIAEKAGLDTYGYAPSSGWGEWIEDLAKAVEIFTDLKNGESTNYTPYGGVYYGLQALSGLLGLPVATSTREAIDLWNNTFGIAYNLKVKTYDPGQENTVKYAYQDGYLTEDEAVKALVEDTGISREKAEGTVNAWDRNVLRQEFMDGDMTVGDVQARLVDETGMDEDEAYWKAQEWAYTRDTGEEYHKYDSFTEAVRTGKNLKSVINEYLDNGVKKETLAGEITSQFKPEYLELYHKGKSSTLIGYLLNAYELLGYDRREKIQDIKAWPEQEKKKKEKEAQEKK